MGGSILSNDQTTITFDFERVQYGSAERPKVKADKIEDTLYLINKFGGDRRLELTEYHRDYVLDEEQESDSDGERKQNSSFSYYDAMVSTTEQLDAILKDGTARELPKYPVSPKKKKPKKRKKKSKGNNKDSTGYGVI